MLAGKITESCKIELVDIPEPQLPDSPGHIVFQPEVTCLCGSDLPFFELNEEVGHTSAVGQSLHEMVGTIVATNGTRWNVGDKVMAVPCDQTGLFERYVLTEDRAVAVDPRVPMEVGMLVQPLGTVICAIKKLPPLIDLDVVMIGQGPMGQLFTNTLKNLGARKIIGIDLLQSRLDFSKRMGATHTICNAVDDPVEAVRELTGGRMADIVIELVGHTNHQINLSIELCRSHGKILSFGVPPKTVDNIKWAELFWRNISIITSVNPTFERDWPLAMQWVAEGRIDVEPMVTQRFPLAEIQQAFETFHRREGTVIKVAVDFPAHTKA